MAMAVTLHCPTNLLQPRRCAKPGLKDARPTFLKPASHSMPTRRELGGMRGHHVRVGVIADEVRTPVEEKSLETFQWTKQWYPLRVPAYMEPDRPHHASLLGKDVVLWKDGSGRWNCFGDMCPHRLAPLSEGRVEADGNLLCSYHAWRFNGDGDCVSIPQSKNEQVEKLRCETPRACAEVYPCVEKQGILWVWGESGAAAQEESKEKEPLVIEELEDPAIVDRVVPVKWGIYNLPYGWEHFMENVVDPAHVGVSHHNIIGSRYDIQRGMEVNMARDITTEGGFQSTDSSTGANTDFRPPCRVRINGFQSGPDSTTSLILYSTPSEPGRCVHIGAQLTIEAEKKKKKGFSLGNPFFSLLKIAPVWPMHLLGPTFLIQDMILLHRQEVYKRKYTADGPDDMAYYTPDDTDRLVRKLRQWIVNCAGGGVPWPKGMSDSDLKASSYDELFDIYKMHTSMCTVCKGAVRNLKMMRAVTIGAAIVAFLKGSPWLLRNSTVSGSGNIISLGLAFLLTGVTVLINKIISMHYVRTFSHADND